MKPTAISGGWLFAIALAAAAGAEAEDDVGGVLRRPGPNDSGPLPFGDKCPAQWNVGNKGRNRDACTGEGFAGTESGIDFKIRIEPV